MELPIQNQEEMVKIGDGTSVATVSITKETVEVGDVRAEDRIHLIRIKQEGGMLILGISWGRTKANLEWKDFSIFCTSSDVTTVIIMRKETETSFFRYIQLMSFKKMVKKLNRGKCELYMARMVQKESKLSNYSNMESEKEVKVSPNYTDFVQVFAVVFRKEIPDSRPPKKDI